MGTSDASHGNGSSRVVRAATQVHEFTGQQVVKVRCAGFTLPLQAPPLQLQHSFHPPIPMRYRDATCSVAAIAAFTTLLPARHRSIPTGCIVLVLYTIASMLVWKLFGCSWFGTGVSNTLDINEPLGCGDYLPDWLTCLRT